MGKDVEWGGASQHAERGYHANKTEAVVAMNMRDEDCLYLCERHTKLSKLQLRTFSTVNHKEFSPYLHNL